jgi:glutamate-1-semialdehyde aminotransferase
MALTNEDVTRLIDWCNEKGYTIREHSHPKTKANWNKNMRRR